MTHIHEAKCWQRYEVCGEHHAHTFHCGGGELGPDCPLYITYKLERLEGEIAAARRHINKATTVVRALQTDVARKLGAP